MGELSSSFFYTWHDIDRHLQFNMAQWPKEWNDVDVYNDQIIVYLNDKPNSKSIEKSSNTLKELFGYRFSPKTNSIQLDYNEQKLNIIYEKSDISSRPEKLPLFKEYSTTRTRPNKLKGTPVIAFHSCKGGVGRTLSLLSFARAISKLRKADETPYKLLLVDGDIEAPGLTWLAQDLAIGSELSLLDALSLVHEADNWRDKALPFIAKKIRESVLRLPVGNVEAEHYLLPAYRDTTQLFSLPVVPETVVGMINRQWIIGDILSELGSLLSVDAVLLDLRAGITEFSSPILFDPRIRKVFVSSTSLQSRRGLNSILKRIYDSPLASEYPIPYLLISMIPDEISDDDLNKIENDILDSVGLVKESNYSENNIDSLDIITEQLPFSSELVHLEGFNLIDKKMAGTPMSKRIQKIAQDWFSNYQVPIETIQPDLRKKYLQDLASRAKEMEFAESTSISDFLVTTPIKNLVTRFQDSVPISVILGAKGSGKTFVYLQLLKAKTWEKFVGRSVKGVTSAANTTYVIPFLRPKNLQVKELDECISNANINLGFNIKTAYLNTREDDIAKYASSNINESMWKDFWRKQLLNGTNCHDLEELQNKLKQKNARVVFIVDGTEEIFLDINNSPNKKSALRALCQGMINELRSIPESRIGLIEFIRHDLSISAIEQNWGQFAALYSQYELKWTSVEALRLALWMSSFDAFFKNETSDIEKATQDVLEKELYKLWGVKLGKPDSNEPYSANWIIVALSDLNLQLQARDMVRFLRNAAKESISIPTSDRVLAPAAIRKAIQPCSEQKIKDIQDEIEYMKDVFSKLKNREKEERIIPLQIEDYELTTKDVKLLEQHGYIVKRDEGYYLPEIIRHGLGFKLAKGARPKVLTLIKRRK